MRNKTLRNIIYLAASFFCFPGLYYLFKQNWDLGCKYLIIGIAAFALGFFIDLVEETDTKMIDDQNRPTLDESDDLTYTKMRNQFYTNLQISLATEKQFKETCIQNNYQYMYIDKNIGRYFSKTYIDTSKRPEYILNIPDLGSIFVDVKAYKQRPFYADSFIHCNKPVPMAYWLKINEINKLQRLQQETQIPVWFAAIPLQNNTPTNQTLFLPVDTATKFITNRHRIQPEYEYVQIPTTCFRQHTNLATNICETCKNTYCTQIDALQQTSEKIQKIKHTMTK